MLIGGAAQTADPLPWRPWRCVFGGQKIKVIFGCIFEVPRTLGMVLGMKFWASIISTIGPSFLTFGHLNIPRVVEGS